MPLEWTARPPQVLLAPLGAPDPLSDPAFQATAMLEWWAKELGVGVDVADLLRLDGSKRAMYRHFSEP